MAELEHWNVFVSNWGINVEVEEDFSGGVTDEWDLDFTVELEHVSIAIDFHGSGEILEGFKLRTVPFVTSNISLEGSVKIDIWPLTESLLDFLVLFLEQWESRANESKG